MAVAEKVAEKEYTIQESAEVWGVNYETARRWIVVLKRIPHRKDRTGGRLKFRVRVRDVLKLKLQLAEEGRYQDYPADTEGE